MVRASIVDHCNTKRGRKGSCCFLKREDGPSLEVKSKGGNNLTSQQRKPMAIIPAEGKVK